MKTGLKRGRPKGRSRDKRSFGPLGDLIRAARMEKGMGLAEIARACECSVQFVSNIEHGRAPLPWEKAGQLASALEIPLERIQAANLSIRSDFKSFVRQSGAKKGRGKASASALALAAQDAEIRQVIERYQNAKPESRKKFVRAALQLLSDRD